MNTRLKKSFAAAGVVIAMSAGSLMLATSAQAASSNCPSGQACIWKDSNYATGGSGTALRGFSMYIPDYGTWNYAGTAENAGNSATSVWNAGNAQNAYFYDNNNPNHTEPYQIVLGIKTGDSSVYDSSGIVKGQPDNTLSAGFFSSYLP
jgi:hypothetical protein